MAHGIAWDDAPAVNEPRRRHRHWLAEAEGMLPAERIRMGGCLMCGGGRKETAPVGPFVLPVPESVPWQSIEIHTLRFGNPPWMAECAPTMDAWCGRHELPLVITDQWDPAYPDPKFCEIDMLKKFLAGDSEWMMYVDADVIVHPLAPRPYFAEAGYHVRVDRYQHNPRQRAAWADWCGKRFGEAPSASWQYRNAGVWACDRAAAAAMLEVIERPYHSGIMEQHHWNWWMFQASLRGMPVRDLATEWNRVPEELHPAWMFHVYAKDKFGNMLKFRKAGLLPDAVTAMQDPPPAPDFGKGAVVWPWKSTEAQWDELWFSHRSVIEYWSEKDWPLVLIGDSRPEWWPGEFIHEPDYARALWIGTHCAERVLWMNDDIILTGRQGPRDLAAARHLEDMRDRLGETMVAPGSWRRGLGQVLMRLHHHGRPLYNFSTHTPYLYEREKVDEVFRVFGAFYKIPFETAYHNWWRSPRARCTEKAGSPDKLAGKLWVNPEPGRFSKAFPLEMAKRFGAPLRKGLLETVS